MYRKAKAIVLLLLALAFACVFGYAGATTAFASDGPSAAVNDGARPEISFLYLDFDEVELGDSQNVAIGFSDGTQIESAILKYSSPSSETASVDAVSIVSSSALFTFSVEELGEYQLDSIEYVWSTDGSSRSSDTVDLSDISFTCA